ncbi:MAG: deoxycytidylate deaminase [Candidatus Kariarchaeaceae archaeon]|jgi:dCMP deaminase
MTRPSWDEYFAEIAYQVATRSTCQRKKVGAIIVKNKSILSTGYNGSIRGLEHCEDIGCLVENGHCVRTVHAEANCILGAARHGINIENATIYTTASPCWYCFQLIANSGIVKIVYAELYRDPKIEKYAKETGIELVDMRSFYEDKPSLSEI